VNRNPDIEYRFLVDKPLGKLAKWLRILGFDAQYSMDPSGGRSAAGQLERKRIFLTRSKKSNPTDPGESLWIESDIVYEQLKEIIHCLGIERKNIKPFTRCIRCNSPLQRIDKSAIRGRIPDYPWEKHTQFHQCPVCRRIFWPGTHIQRNREIIKRLFIG
jgi:uncharacterized protein with PIN domain